VNPATETALRRAGIALERPEGNRGWRVRMVARRSRRHANAIREAARQSLARREGGAS